MFKNHEIIQEIIRTARNQGRHQLSDAEAFRLVCAAGVPVPEYRVVKPDIPEICQAARELGYPLALKTLSSRVLHKTEIGGVITGIGNDRELEEASLKMKIAADKHNIDTFLLQRMVPGEVETIIGGTKDDIFGETVIFGLGGCWVEVFKDVSLRLAPVTQKEARSMMEETRMAPLLEEFRGRKALPVEELASLIVKISELLSSYDIRELDLNPVMVGTESISCVDAKILIGKENTRSPAKGSCKGKQGLEAIFDAGNILLVGSSEIREEIGMTSPAAFASIEHNLRTFFKKKKNSITVLDIGAGGPKQAAEACRALLEKGTAFDLAVFLLPPGKNLMMLRLLQHSIRGLVHLGSGPKTKTRERQEYLEIIHEQGIRVIGPNSILGVMDTASGLNTSFEKGFMPQKGSISVLSQSGGVGAALLDLAVHNNIGIASFVFMGEKIDVDDIAILQALKDDKNTSVIAIYMEGIDEGSGRNFVATVRDLVKTKPVVVLKGGRSEASAERARSHTSSTAGSDEIFNAAFHEAGIIRVNDIGTLFNTALALSSQPPMKGKKVVVVSNVGGPAILAADSLEEEGLVLTDLDPQTKTRIRKRFPAIDPLNPLDLIADAGAERYGFVLKAVLEDPEVDGVMLIDMMKSTYFKPEYARVFRDIVAGSKIPVVNVVPGGGDFEKIATELQGSGIPCFDTPAKGARALKHLHQYWLHRERIIGKK